MTNRINGNSYKASTTGATDTGGASTLSQLQADIQEALRQMAQLEAEYGEFFNELQMYDLNRLKVTLKAEAAAIAAIGVEGANYNPLVGQDASYWEDPTQLDDGWNGILPDYINPDSADEARLAGNSDSWDYGEYMGTMEVENSGDPYNPTKIGFQMTDDMEGFYARSMGRDIVFTVEYKDGTRKSWILRNGTMLYNPIVISALNHNGPVTIDLSGVIKVGRDEDSELSDFYIFGSDYDDTIRGSQGVDSIAGMSGDDKIYGELGNDFLHGDAPVYDPSVIGNDIIIGGGGVDDIDGGRGLDTVSTLDEGEYISGEERWIDEKVNTDTLNEILSDNFFPPSDEWDYVIEDGMIVLRHDGDRAGDITLDMSKLPAGYDMAYAERDSDGSLVITFIGDEGSFKVKIEDFFYEFDGDTPSDCIPRLTIIGTDGADIIDFSRVEVTSQVINIKGGAGDDVILGAKNELLANGLEPGADLTNSRGSGNLQNYIDEGVFAYDDDTGEFYAEREGNQIEIKYDETYGENGESPAPTLNLCAPDGYEKGFITSDANGNLYVVLVNNSGDGRAKTIVFKISKELLDAKGFNYEDIRLFKKTSSGEELEEVDWSPIALTPVSMFDDYYIDGGEGNDLIFTQKRGNVKNSSEDDVVEGKYGYDDRPPPSNETEEVNETNETDETDETDETEENDD